MGDVSPGVRAALGLLLQAHRYAEQVGCTAWDFAVEIHLLARAGSNHNDLRWLVCKNYLCHATEVTAPHSDRRCFRGDGPLRFGDATCFVLTEQGVAFANAVCGAAAAETAPARPVPRWDPDRQELSFDGALVKQFRSPAPNQFLVLTALQEEDWPPRIDDPLPPLPSVEPKRRLHDTIQALNRHQHAPRIQFMGDGRGVGVLWRPRPPAADRPTGA
jgi:hypothetical protein